MLIQERTKSLVIFQTGCLKHLEISQIFIYAYFVSSEYQKEIYNESVVIYHWLK